MNIKHIGNPGNMTVEVTGIDSTTRASLAESFLTRYSRGPREPVTYRGTEEEYERFRAFLDEAEGEARVKA